MQTPLVQAILGLFVMIKKTNCSKQIRKLLHIFIIGLFLPQLFRSQIDSGKVTELESGFFKSTRFCQPFVSEVQNYKPQLALLYARNNEEYDISNSGKPYKLFQYTAAGFEIPLYRKFVYRDNKLSHAFGISSVLAFHLWWDPFEMSTSPILSTDYRANTVLFKYIRFLNGKLVRNFSLKVAPFNHESTHIGDDLTLYRIDKNYPITRVNVSYEYSELNLTLNDPNGETEQNHSLRLGWIYRLNGNEDYYSVNENEGDPNLVRKTGLTSEYYVQYNMIRSNGWLSFKKWKNVFSAEVRNRVRYQYPEFNTSNGGMEILYPSNKRAFTFNIYFGYKFVKPKGPTPGIYMHVYSGINPYGQFRNKGDFQGLGFTLVLE